MMASNDLVSQMTDTEKVGMMMINDNTQVAAVPSRRLRWTTSTNQR